MTKAAHGVLIAAALSVNALATRHAHADDVERGRALAEKLCAVCHLNPGQGEKTGVDEVPGFVAVAKRKSQTFRGIVDWLKSVPPMMPDHHLTQDEMFALAAFILSLRDKP
ncbi:MAG: cytochrome c [Pseudomonadota bacterium]